MYRIAITQRLPRWRHGIVASMAPDVIDRDRRDRFCAVRLRQVCADERARRHRPESGIAGAAETVDPHARYRARRRLERRRQTDRRAGLRRERLRHRLRSSALAIRTAQRRRTGRRNQCAAASGRRQRPEGRSERRGDETRRRRHAQRQPHHAAARCRRRRRRRNAHRIPAEPDVAVRHGADRRHLLRRQCRCGGAFSI